jgi:hypothetical protein
MLILSVALFGAFLFADAPAPAATATPTATIAVLPFGTPDKHSGYDDQATTILTDDLNAHGAVAVDADMIDHSGFTFDAKSVCAAKNVTRIVAGRLKVDETTRNSAAGKLIGVFVPFGGLATASGAMLHTNTRVHFDIAIFDCASAVQWENKDVYGDASKDGSNAPAAVTAALHVAIDKILVALPTGVVTSLPTPEPSATPSAAPSPGATP